jgi:AcrR family transcriptional regulator
VGGLVSAETFPAVTDAHRRARILLALASCMAEKGYRATTISDIARVGRVSKTVVYAHFRDKEECLLELVSRATDKVIEAIIRAQTDAERRELPWRERLRATVAALLDALASGPEVAWATVVEIQAAGTAARALRRSMIDRYVDLICTTADDLASQFPSEVRRVDRHLVLAAVGGIHELMLACLERGHGERLRAETDAATAVLVDLLEQRTGAGPSEVSAAG